MPRVMTIWLPRWPVQRRLLERPELRRVPVFVCRPKRRGVMTVVSWAWAAPPRGQPADGAAGRRSGSAAGHPSGSAAGHPSGNAVLPPRIPEGMSLAEAMAVLAITHGSRACRLAAVEDDDPLADRLALEQLARYCRRFSPCVAIDTVSVAGLPAAGPPQGTGEPARGDCLHLDVTGTAGFFGGEAALARTVVWTLAARGVHARVGVADTHAAAWAAARHTDALHDPLCPPARGGFQQRHRRFAVVPAGEQARFLAGLPVSALRLDAAAVAQLAELGIDTIGGVVRLPRKSLAARFDPHVSRRLAQFSGAVAEPPAPSMAEELPAASQAFDFPLSLRDTTEDELLAVVARLVRECVGPLAARGKGVLSLQVRLDHGRTADAAGPRAPVVIDVGVFQPTVSAAHLVELVRLRIARMRLPREIDAVAAEVVSAGDAVCRQRTLFGAAAEASATEVSMLLDRLSGRLGRAAVFSPVAVADAQPEHGWTAVPPSQSARPPSRCVGAQGGRNAPAAGSPARPRRRPIWLLPQPVRLEAVCLKTVCLKTVALVDGESSAPPARLRRGTQVHEVVRAHGPERIETAWWRGPTVRRDYYEIETRSGSRYWIFRRLGRGGAAGQWFLHGMFS